ncbi:2-(1,2-epoxy-1,2-dihydrophenyl)acetyl-CoA isomerase [Nocardioides sp. BE266]|uniref:enoyl-CoA hydratase/isomerase family protein n=1 Tax=Nocardioides sp. BE266 TaxID=2817725 RepID=UPI00285488CF|nr:enoyl-CoA hydratase-related protein [Nocardioides sp. BE266]MDR7252657.1 2-(1,2-epoxy-1,2-dihydrophenyl)acetyl-CoA isomerase [Nocardioides sp. BE266]
MTAPLTASETAPVLLTVVDSVATITLNRPDAMNGLDVATKELLLETVQQVADDPTVRCVVLTGSGRAFCVGQDLKEHLAGLKGEADIPLSDTVEKHYNPIVHAIATMPKPVVAAVNGVAAGAGASLAFAADFRILVDSAGYNTSFAGVALSCDTGSSWTLPRLVGTAKAMELLYFPRTVTAQEALELGLATQVVPEEGFKAAVGELATRLAAGPTVAFGSIRQAVANSAAHPLDESLAFEAEKMALTGGTEDHLAAVDAFVAKEKPVFQGR